MCEPLRHTRHVPFAYQKYFAINTGVQGVYVRTCLFWEAELFFFSADGETGDTETDSVQENFDDVNQALIIQNLISVVMSDLYPYASSMRCLWAS